MTELSTESYILYKKQLSRCGGGGGMSVWSKMLGGEPSWSEKSRSKTSGVKRPGLKSQGAKRPGPKY